MAITETRPVATSIRVDQEHTLEMRADMASKTAEVENVATGEMYTSGGGGGGESDFSTAEVTIANVETTISSYYYLPTIREDEFKIEAPMADETESNITIVLYKNSVVVYDVLENPVISGNAAYNEEARTLIITGACTLKGMMML